MDDHCWLKMEGQGENEGRSILRTKQSNEKQTDWNSG
jgi:hypothetical protein